MRGAEYIGTVCIHTELSVKHLHNNYNNNIILASLMSVKNPPGTSLGSSGLLWKNLKLILESVLGVLNKGLHANSHVSALFKSNMH